jgi:hypothetical protein
MQPQAHETEVPGSAAGMVEGILVRQVQIPWQLGDVVNAWLNDELLGFPTSVKVRKFKWPQFGFIITFLKYWNFAFSTVYSIGVYYSYCLAKGH